MARPAPADETPVTPEPTPPVADETPVAAEAAPEPSPPVMVLGYVDYEVDSAPDHNGVVSKIKVHSLGLVPVGK